MRKSDPLLFEYRIHAVTSVRVLESADFYSRAEALCGTGKVALHLRAHELTGRLFLEKARKLRDLTAGVGAPLVINDRLDVALAVGADALHLGERSMPVYKAVPLCRDNRMCIGLSCHDTRWAALGVANSVDYLYLGTVFPSPGKPDTEPCGVSLVKEISGLAGRPVFAIGGITPDNVAQAVRAGAFGCAAITGLWESPDPERAVRDYEAAIKGAGPGRSEGEHAGSDRRAGDKERIDADWLVSRDGWEFYGLTGEYAMITVVVNGEKRQVKQKATVVGLLENLGIDPGHRVAVERNREIVPRRQYADTPVEDGDIFEVVEFVGGG
ncbi:MAG: sulfur carrier protein ThiS [Gemmatimonadota bacterium]|nr:sulfur carrier protein ThiS [Gemmatimonadota bacterium]